MLLKRMEKIIQSIKSYWDNYWNNLKTKLLTKTIKLNQISAILFDSKQNFISSFRHYDAEKDKWHNFDIVSYQTVSKSEGVIIWTVKIKEKINAI